MSVSYLVMIEVSCHAGGSKRTYKGHIKDIFGPFQKILSSYLPLINLNTRFIHLHIKCGIDSHEPD